LLENPKAKGIALDLVGGDTPIEQAVEDALARGESDFKP
jgi:hypothetical protein